MTGVMKLEPPMLLLKFISPPKKGEFGREDKPPLPLGCLDSWTMLSLRSTDFTSDPELGSFNYSIIPLCFLGFKLPEENTFPVIENLCPIMFEF